MVNERNLRPLKITNEEFLDILKSMTITATPKIKKETKLAIGSTNTNFSNKPNKLPKIFDVLSE